LQTFAISSTLRCSELIYIRLLLEDCHCLQVWKARLRRSTMTRLSTCRLLLALLTMTQVNLELAAAFEERCGDCWCVPEGGTEKGTCPSYNETIIHQTFPDGWADSYSSFVLDSDLPELVASDGNSSCYPFQGTVSPVTNYPASQHPACQTTFNTSVKVDSSSDSTVVCAYKFSDPSAECDGRSYTMQVYESAQDAIDDDAMPVHSGVCGVCSSAQDLATRIATAGSLNPISISCATK
jgi:hypothetical protein